MSTLHDHARRSRSRRAFDAIWRSTLRLGFPVLKLWWRFTHPTLQGVYLAVWCGGRVLMIRNSYQKGYSFPSGRRGRNEPPARAAARELREEVGLDVSEERLIEVHEWTLETTLVADHVHVFEVRLDAEPAIHLDHREVIWAAFETPSEARRRPLLPVVARYLDGRSAPTSAREEPPTSP